MKKQLTKHAGNTEILDHMCKNSEFFHCLGSDLPINFNDAATPNTS